MSSLYEIFRMDKFIETQSRLMVVYDFFWGAFWGENGE